MMEDAGEATIRGAFERIYRQDTWSHGSGPGSRPVNTIEYRAFLERFIEANDVRTVTDLGCGDWQSSKQIDWSAVQYVGFDVVESIVAQNRERHARQNISFSTFRSIDDLPGGDLLVCKEVLQHLPTSTIIKYIPKFREKYRFSLLTNARNPTGTTNSDVEAGGYRPLNLHEPPFSVPGATVLTYFPRQGDFLFHNIVYLVMGSRS